MRKIPTLFQRRLDDRRYVDRIINSDCSWVLNGEGVATRKYDGTCVRLDDDGQWWARREVKRGKTAPENFMPVETDDTTGKTVGWEPIEQSSFAKFHAEAVEPLTQFGALVGQPMKPGTFELIGPKINGNPEGCMFHRLERHAAAEQIDGLPLDFEGLREAMRNLDEEGIEGVVWHHPDGRMAKLKVRDFPRDGS
ncbi:DUF5565 family protein [Prauserella rugosa]|uniref:RNA ligase n=1 Tax=Prauserella rugosa TaxID=43354 RepID=A0A660C4T3_9PSEU|nr:DUF5565 family protein [Prauserella rugosa]KMS86165.1 mucin [Streptomyces regensis]TWH18550.1 hypothetical protein JD82_00369 [Prauserella rugosa]